MKVLAIYGSPRVEGNSDIMMNNFLKGFIEKDLLVERIYVRKLKINGCLGCGYCDDHGICFQKDDMQKLYPLLVESSFVVVASPNYFYNIPGQLKCLIDRSQALFMAYRKGFITKREGRKGFFLGVGATKGKKLFDCSILTMKYFFDAIGVSYEGELCFKGIDEKGAINNYPDYLKRCYQEGMRFVELLSTGTLSANR